MNRPKRTAAHVTESRSRTLLAWVAPTDWIARDVSERDYGIDYYIEIASKGGDITGELFSAQLKGVERLDWKEKKGKRTAHSPRIKSSTARYWLDLPVPVFLLVADLAAKKVYYASVKEKIRTDFGKLKSQHTISFPLCEKMHFPSEIPLFNWFVYKERQYAHFTVNVVNLLSHVGTFMSFIQGNQQSESHMEVEVVRYLQFRSLYEICKSVSLFLHPGWELESLDTLYRLDREKWKDDCVWLHEETLVYARQKLEPIFSRVVRQALTLVTETQASYWHARDPVFFSLCQSGEIHSLLRELERSSSSKNK
jgi:hypothetical protein